MILYITPDRDVYRYADDTTADLLQHLAVGWARIEHKIE